MDTVGPRKLKAYNYQERIFNIYTLDEADEAGIQYKTRLTEVPKPGAWVVTGDFFVCEVIKVSRIDNIKNYVSHIIQLPFCVFWSKTKSGGRFSYKIPEYLAFKHSPGSSSSHTNPSDWPTRELRRSRVRQGIALAAAIMARNRGKLTQEEWILIGTIMGPWRKYPMEHAKKLFKQPKIQAHLSMEISKLLSGIDIDVEEVLERYNEAYKVAKKLGRAGDMLAATDRFAKLLGLDNMKQLKGRDEDESIEDAEFEDITLEIENHEINKSNAEVEIDGDN